MPDRPDRFYITTSIAYANNKPGLHTLYEVIGADALARWHRMRGIPTRFLTGTDEHSVNIAMKATEEGRTPRDFVDEKVAMFRESEAALLISPDRFIRTTDPDHIEASQEMVRRAYAKGDIYVGTYEGWYCPNEGFRNATDVQETDRGTICPNHPEVPLQWLTERNWFFRLSAYQERLERWFLDNPDAVQPDYRRNEMLGFIRSGLEDASISRSGAGWGIAFPVLPDGSDARRPDGTWDPDAGTIYVWYDALINYITGAGFPGDPESFARWWPADLHVIGKDIARFHTIFWPAMLWSAGLEAPRHVWIHGWLLAQGERMSKSRGNFLDPLDFVRAFGADGARYVALREVGFDRDADVSWDAFTRRYNADLANDFGNLVNRTVSMAARYLGGARPAPAGGSLKTEWQLAADAFRAKARCAPDQRGAGGAVGLRRQGQPRSRGGAALGAREAGQGRRRGGPGAAGGRPGRPGRSLPAGGARGGAGDARGGIQGARPARLRLPVGGGRQRRSGARRRARLGRARGRGWHAGRPGAPLPEDGDRSRRGRGRSRVMTAAEIRQANGEALEALRALVADLAEADYAVDCGEGWTVGLIFGHLAFWDRWQAARWAEAGRSGRPRPAEVSDNVNEYANEALEALLAAIPGQAAGRLAVAAAEHVTTVVAALPDAAIEGVIAEGRERLANRGLHRMEHVQQVREALGRVDA